MLRTWDALAKAVCDECPSMTRGRYAELFGATGKRTVKHFFDKEWYVEVSEKDRDYREEFAEAYPDVPIWTSVQEMLKHEGYEDSFDIVSADPPVALFGTLGSIWATWPAWRMASYGLIVWAPWDLDYVFKSKAVSDAYVEHMKSAAREFYGLESPTGDDLAQMLGGKWVGSFSGGGGVVYHGIVKRRS